MSCCRRFYLNLTHTSAHFQVVVIIVIWIISILVIYMLFLMCLDPLLNKRVKANYQEHTNEDVHSKHSRYSGIQYSLLVTAEGDDEDDDVDADAAQLVGNKEAPHF